MGRECFESLPETELHQIYQLHQQVQNHSLFKHMYYFVINLVFLKTQTKTYKTQPVHFSVKKFKLLNIIILYF